MRALLSVAGAALVALTAALGLVLSGPAARADGGWPGSDGFTLSDPRITESSGLAASRAHPGIYWTHNDSGDGPYLYAVDARTGKTVATVTLSGIGSPRDVEAISLGPGDELWVGDIGDNLNGSWDHVWLYRLPEPKTLRDQTVRATQYVVRYADGPRDAEALMVHPVTGRVYIASKNEDGGKLYAGPEKLSTTAPNVFHEVAPVDLWVTDGAFSPDGGHLALRGYLGGILYAWRGGRPEREAMLTVPLQRQGESLTYTPDGKTLLYGSEGAGSTVRPGKVPGAEGPAGSPTGRPGGGHSGGGPAADGEPPSFGRGAAVLVLALLVVLGGKKAVARRGK